MIIKKIKHKNITNNIQRKQAPSYSPLASKGRGGVSPVADGSQTTTDLWHLLSHKQPLDLKQHRRNELHQEPFSEEHHQDAPHQYVDGHHHHHYVHRMCYLSSLVMAVVLGVILLPLPTPCNAVGYSYTRFRGPVSGPEHRIYVHNNAASSSYNNNNDRDEESHLDYVAKPEYEFAYGVEDAQAHILHNRNEMRDGDTVKGVYR